MKYFLLPILSLFAFSLPTLIKAQKVVGLYNEKPFSTGYRFGKAKQQGMAIAINNETARALRGTQLEGLRTQLRTYSARKITVFVTYKLGEEPIFTQTFDNKSTKPTIFTFKHPVTITGKPFYVGFTTESPNEMCSPLSFDENAPYAENLSYVLVDGSWDAQSAKPLGGANVQMVLNNGAEFTDLIMKPFEISGIFKDAHKYSFDCEAFNCGTDTIKQVVIGVKVGENKRLEEIRDVLIAPNESYIFKSPDYLISEGKQKEQKVHIDIAPTDYKDINLNNNSAENKLGVLPANYNRKILAEFFTSESCGNCPYAYFTWNYKIVNENADLFVNVSHHNGYTPDRFSMAEGQVIADYFDVQSTPGMMLNRKYLVGNNVVFHGANIIEDQQALDLVLADESPLQVMVKNSYDPQTRECEFKVDVETFTTPSNAKEHYLNVWIVQDSLVAFQANHPDKQYTKHNGLLRKSLTYTWGEKIELEIGKINSRTFKYILPEVFKSTVGVGQFGKPEFEVVPENMSIVAFVCDHDEVDNKKSEVFNVVKVPLIQKSADEVTGVSTPLKLGLELLVRGHQLIVNGDYNILEVFASNGRLVKRIDSSVPCTNLDGGIYVVRISRVDGTQYTQKVVMP